MMRKIKSFQINHDLLVPGLYVSRKDGSIITYDLRFVKPNGGTYLSTAVLHTLEHCLATYLRSSPCKEYIVYVGPMGCRTGMYILVDEAVPQKHVLDLIVESLWYVVKMVTDIPGATQAECGNYLDHDLAGAKSAASEMLDVLKSWNSFEYPQ